MENPASPAPVVCYNPLLPKQISIYSVDPMPANRSPLEPMKPDTVSHSCPPAAVGVIGGSGLYAMQGLGDLREISVETPFGPPSDLIQHGTLGGRPVYFLSRHGRGHRLLPTEIPHRANLWALRALGVRWLFCVTAVGSLRDELAPRDVVVVDQLIDRTSSRPTATFFGDGLVAHVAFADPYSPRLRQAVLAAAAARGLRAHDGGTYVCMDGPAFSTRAESRMHRLLGGDVIGMTNAAEAKLAREAEIAVATLAMVTDYDCWRDDLEAVTTDSVLAHVEANAAAAKLILATAIPALPESPSWPEHRTLDGALFTPPERWPAHLREKLHPILARLSTRP
jgi:5'-methylthioadenosine phosphorylase